MLAELNEVRTGSIAACTEVQSWRGCFSLFRLTDFSGSTFDMPWSLRCRFERRHGVGDVVLTPSTNMGDANGKRH